MLDCFYMHSQTHPTPILAKLQQKAPCWTPLAATAIARLPSERNISEEIAPLRSKDTHHQFSFNHYTRLPGFCSHYTSSCPAQLARHCCISKLSLERSTSSFSLHYTAITASTIDTSLQLDSVMNPSQNSPSMSGKLNPSSASFSPPAAQQPSQTIQPGPEFFARRSSSTSNQTFNNQATARNNQAQKKKHKKLYGTQVLMTKCRIDSI